MNETASPRGTSRQPPGRCRPGAAAPVARLVGAAALLAVACLALSPEAGAQNAPPTAADNTVTTAEDTPYTFAAADFNFSDTDSGDTLASVKIVTLPTRGSLTNDGTAVTANQAITKADIDAGKLVFAPEANAAASAYAGFTFKVSDGTDDSALAYTMIVSVTRVNDPPTAANQIFSMVEDSSRIFSTVDFGYFDVDPGDALEGVRIVAPPSRGSLTNDGTAVMAGQSIPVADIRGSKLVFTPAPNDVGSPYTSFTFRVSDGTAESATTYRATFHVLGVPDQPTAADNTVATAEDTPYSFAVADFNFSDPDPGDTLATVRFATLPAAGSLTNDGAAVSVGQRIPRADIDAGKLLFTPAADAFGDPYASFTFRVQDGSTSSVSAYTMTVDVTPVNDPPTAANQFFAMDEDESRIFLPADFGNADVDPGDSLRSVTIVTLPSRGSLTVSGTPVTAGQSIPIGLILGNHLAFTPAANGFGSPYTTFTFKVSDGTAESAAAYTMTFTVLGLNDRPTAADNAVATAEDTHYSFAVADFNFSDVDVGHTLATVTIVTLPAAGSLTNNSVSVSVGQRIPDTDIQAGNLVFTPAADAFGDPYASFTFRVSDGDEQSASAYTMTVRVTAVNDPPTADDPILIMREDTSRILEPADFGFADVDPGDSLQSVTIVTLPSRGSLTNDGTAVTANQSIPVADIIASKLVFTPAANAFGDPFTSFTFKVSDGTAESATTYRATIAVFGVHDLPTGADNAVATAEDTPYTFAAADFHFADADPGDILVAVTIVTLPAAGSLTDDGTAVTANQPIRASNILAGIQAGNLVFTPAADAFGDPYASFTFTVSDGARTSASAYTMTVRVTAVNDPPTADNQRLSLNEDTPHTFTALDFGFADVDPGDTLASVTIVTPPAAGSLTNDGTAVTANQSISRADIDAGKLVFAPAADAVGVLYAAIDFKVSDGTAESADRYLIDIDVIAVPEPPTAADNAVATAEDTPYTFAAADFNFADVDPGDTLASVTIVTPPAAGALTDDGTAVTAGQSIARADIDASKLVFTPAANAFGDPYASFTFRVSDGTDESAAAYTMTVAVTAVNDPPTAADNTVATPKDTPYVFAAGAFGFADVDPGDALASVTIATLPAAGSLTNDGTAVTVDQSIAVADIDADKLVFTPATNAIGDPYASFTFKVSDGTADSASAYTMTVDVTDANAAPTAANGGATTAEDTPYAFSVADFGFADADMGDTLAAVLIVTLPGAGLLTIDGAPVTAGQPIARVDIDASKLVFVPAANAFGDPYASFAFRVSDGTDDSVAAYSVAAYTVTVDVTPVPDPPTAADNTIATAEDTPYAFSAADFGFADADPGDALASVTIATLPAAGSLTNDGTAVTAGQSIARADIDAGRLVFAPAAGAVGEAYASFTFTVSDGTAESASAYTMTVDVTDMPAVPDANAAPTAASGEATTAEDTPYAFAAADFGFSDADPGDTLASVRIVTLPAAGSLTDGGAAVTAGQSIARADIDAGRLVFAPAANAFGDPYASFAFRVSDGTDESAAAYTMTVAVTAVNDPPAAADSTVVTPENTPYAFAADDFNFSDTEADDALASVRIVTLPAAGSLTDGGTPVTAGQSIARAGIDAGRLVFAPAANRTGAPYASFTFTVSDGTDESAAAYTMTIDVTPSVETATIEAWNVRLGRAIGVQAVDAVTSRFEAADGSQVTLGGRRVGGTGPGVAGEEAGFADRPGWLEEAENAAGPRATRGMSGRELLRQSAFHLTGGGAGERPAYTLWGRMAFGAFEARVDETTLKSDVTTGFIGVDGQWGRVLAGVAVALSDSEGSYRPVASRSGGFDRGRIQADLTGVYPYARFALAEDLSVWGLVGYGAGDLTVKPEGQASILTRVAMRMGALGVKGRIFEGEEPDDLRLSVKSDAMWVQTESGRERDLDPAIGSANRLRLILDAESDFGAAAGTTVTPSGEIGLRFDEGDAGTGVGMELGAGMRYAAGAFTVEGSVRALVAHEAKGRKEWGVSGSAALSPGALGRGPWFALQPVWGEAESGTETLWSLDDASPGGSERAFEAKGRLDARMGYGFEVLADRLTATPELGLRLAESYRRYSFGWRLERARPARLAFGLLFEATRREAAGGDRPPEHGVGVRLTAGW